MAREIRKMAFFKKPDYAKLYNVISTVMEKLNLVEQVGVFVHLT